MQRDTGYYERLRRWRKATGRRLTEEVTEPDDDSGGIEIPEDYEPEKPKPIALSATPRREAPDPWN